MIILEFNIYDEMNIHNMVISSLIWNYHVLIATIALKLSAEFEHKRKHTHENWSKYTMKAAEVSMLQETVNMDIGVNTQEHATFCSASFRTGTMISWLTSDCLDAWLTGWLHDRLNNGLED